MRIIGIDGATNKTGIAYFEDGRYITHTLIDLHKIKDASERIPKMMIAICDFINTQHVDKIIMEESMMTNNIDTVKKHLSVLEGSDREMYCILGKKLVEIAGIKNPDRDYTELSKLL